MCIGGGGVALRDTVGCSAEVSRLSAELTRRLRLTKVEVWTSSALREALVV